MSTGSGEGCCTAWVWLNAQAQEGSGATGADTCSVEDAPCERLNGWDVGACPMQYMVGSYQHTTDGLYGSLTGKEEVKLTLTFLLDSLFFQVLDILGMWSVK